MPIVSISNDICHTFWGMTCKLYVYTYIYIRFDVYWVNFVFSTTRWMPHPESVNNSCSCKPAQHLTYVCEILYITYMSMCNIHFVICICAYVPWIFVVFFWLSLTSYRGSTKDWRYNVYSFKSCRRWIRVSRFASSWWLVAWLFPWFCLPGLFPKERFSWWRRGWAKKLRNSLQEEVHIRFGVPA